MGKKRNRDKQTGHASSARTQPVATPVPDTDADGMPLPEGAYALLADYEQRSRAHDPGLPEQIEAPGLWRAIGFRVGEHQFVSGIDEISEILMAPPPLTTIPSTKSWLLGVANVRGNLVSMVDLKQFLFDQRTHVTGRSRVLVVRQSGGNVGLLVDELLGQRNLTDADRVGAEGEADPGLARFVTENVTAAGARLGRFSMVDLARTPEFQHAGI